LATVKNKIARSFEIVTLRLFPKTFKEFMKMSYRKLIVFISSVLTCTSLGAAAPTSPPMDGLALWLNGDQGITTNSSGGVTLWADQSGNANDAAQSDDAQAPALKLNRVNGHAAVNFDGGDDFLDVVDSSTLENMGDIATFAVVRFDDFGTYRAVWGKTLANKPAATDWYFVPGSGAPNVYRGDGGSDIMNVPGTKGPKADSYAVVGFQMSGTTLTHT
jgi:hypothetical protein